MSSSSIWTGGCKVAKRQLGSSLSPRLVVPCSPLFLRVGSIMTCFVAGRTIPAPSSFLPQSLQASILGDQDEGKHLWLASVIVHVGEGSLDGHYVIYNYYRKQRVWLCFDDAEVSRVLHSDVEAASFGEDQKSTAHYLMYASSSGRHTLNCSVVHHSPCGQVSLRSGEAEQTPGPVGAARHLQCEWVR